MGAPEGASERRPSLNGERNGDISYLTIETPDSARARAFFGVVLGWQFSPGRVEDGWNVDAISPIIEMQGGKGRPVVVPMYRVDDIALAVEKVRALGGRATYPMRKPYGLISQCNDDQGIRFYLGQL